MKKNKYKWNGNAHLANNIFGERYGIDWEYIYKGSSDIIVRKQPNSSPFLSGKIIKVGQEINI